MKKFDSKKECKKEKRSSAEKQQLYKQARIKKAESRHVKNMLNSACKSKDFESLKEFDF